MRGLIHGAGVCARHPRAKGGGNFIQTRFNSTTRESFEFKAPANGGSKPRNTPWLGLLSTGTDGIRLTPDAWLPLRVDPLILNSAGFGWLGVLTTKQPTGLMKLPIPNNPRFACGKSARPCAGEVLPT